MLHVTGGSRGAECCATSKSADPAAEIVAELLDAERALMSWINLGEVHCVLRRAHGEDAAMETIRDMRDVIDARLPDEALVLNAARIKADHPMSSADAFGAALAVTQDADLWTGDPELPASVQPGDLNPGRPFRHPIVGCTVHRSEMGGPAAVHPWCHPCRNVSRPMFTSPPHA